ncbi:MAG: Ig-like domain-containing protein [Acidimicrobiales bacterium]
MSRLARLLAAAGLATLAIAGLTLGATAARATPMGGAAGARSGATPKRACAPGATCVTIPSPCPSGSRCPTVSVEPSNGLGQNQWIYLNFSDFAAGSVAQIYYCENQTPLTATSPPYCVLEGTPTFTYPNQELPISANGSGAMSFQTLDDPNVAGDTALVGQIPGDTTAPPQNFYCGDTADQCSVDVVDWSLLSSPRPSNIAIPLPSDTAVIPLGFAPQSNGCQQATLVSTFSDNSIEWLIPHESPVVCKQQHAAVALNTSTSTSLILGSLQNGNVVFLDDPQAADVRAALSKVHYAVVPVVASAVVMGYVAAMEQQGLSYPFNDFRLTPNEVAGLVTYAYQGPYDGDLVKCKGGPCSALQGLNSVRGFVGAGQYGVFIPSETTSVTETITNWVCNAPNVPFVLNGKLITDPNSAQKTFTTSVNQRPWPITRCTTFDQFPALKPFATLFEQAADPIHAVKYLRTFAVPPQFQPSPVAGFAPIDWGDARYYGLDAAALQNAAGQFIAPSTASVQAEIAAEPLSNAGYPLPDAKLRVRGGYPMSTVIDALVPEGPLPATQSKPIAQMMTDLLDYTTTAPLPDGYVRLPAKLRALAHRELTNALEAETGAVTRTRALIRPTSVTQGHPVRYVAKVSSARRSPTGNVTFTTGATTLCSAQLTRGRAACTASDAPVGFDNVTASYAGTVSFGPSVATATLDVSAPPPPPTTVVTVTTMPPRSRTTTTTTTVRSTVPSTVPSKAKGSGPSTLSVADVRLAAAADSVALPIALAAGGALIALSLGLSFVGVLRRRHAGRTEGA